jgi:membrane fusion protein, multidrug efflux system
MIRKQHMKLTSNSSYICPISLFYITLIGVVISGCDFHRNADTQSTNDAYITADYTLVAPKVSGVVEQVFVEDNQLIKAGEPLITIDPRDYKAELDSAIADVGVASAEIEKLDAEIARQPMLIDQAKANLQSADAMVALAKSNSTRYSNLSEDGAGTIQENQQAMAQLSHSQAIGSRENASLKAAKSQLRILIAERTRAISNLKKAEAHKDQAALKLSYTTITAPIDGVVGRRSVRQGGFVSAGTVTLAIVPISKQYVLANFQENQMEHLRRFQPVTITVDSFPGMNLKGYVESLAPATDVAFSPIQPDNATGNFTKIVQRIPVKIALNATSEQLSKLRVGMSVIPTINTEQMHSDELIKESAK